MQLHGTLTRLISLASVLSVLGEPNLKSSYEVRSVAEERAYSDTTKNIYELAYGTDICGLGTFPSHVIHPHLKESKSRFDSLAKQIDASIAKGQYIHVEDGEADDYMQNLISAMRGVVPKQVYLQGGHLKKRLEVAHILWDYLVSKFGIRKPEILTISARVVDFAPFDSAEGFGLLSAERIAELDRETNPRDFQQALTDARDKLIQTLTNNDFTTIVLKTAPAELPDVLKDFSKKVAIIWTGPIEKRANTNTYEKAFNYYQASQAADELLSLDIPTVLVSPWLQNARMTSIIDEKYMNDYRKFVGPVEGFESFDGFKGLAEIQLKKKAKFSHYFFSLADKFRDEMIREYERLVTNFNAEQHAIEENRTLRQNERAEKLSELKNVRAKRLALGERWSFFRRQNTGNEIFREFCPVDQTVELVTDPSLRSSVQEVLQVEMIPHRQKDTEVYMDASVRGNTYIITKFNSEPLETKIQDAIYWMANGEPGKLQPGGSQ